MTNTLGTVSLTLGRFVRAPSVRIKSIQSFSSLLILNLILTAFFAKFQSKLVVSLSNTISLGCQSWTTSLGSHIHILDPCTWTAFNSLVFLII